MSITLERPEAATSVPTPTDAREKRRDSKKRGRKVTTKASGGQRSSDEPKSKKPRGKKPSKAIEPTYPHLGRGETVTAWIGLNEDMRREFERQLIKDAFKRGWRGQKKSSKEHGLLVIAYARAIAQASRAVPDGLCLESRQAVAEVFMTFCDAKGLVYGTVDAD